MLILSACATHPDKINSHYVASSKYMTFTCAEIHGQMDVFEGKASNLYRKLKKDRKTDNVAMTVGMVLFWPALFFVEGDSPDAQTYAQVKGEAEALQEAHDRLACT